MKNYFVPDFMFAGFWDITPEFIRSLGVRAIVLDIDNTLVTYGMAEPTEQVIEWVKGMKEAGLLTEEEFNNMKAQLLSDIL